jgi:hypothetical protein
MACWGPGPLQRGQVRLYKAGLEKLREPPIESELQKAAKRSGCWVM